MSTIILPGDVLETLNGITPGSIRCCVTSPPYYGLRSYLKNSDPLKQFEIGSEKTPELYIEKMVKVFRLVHNALSDDGTLWLNIGDSYVNNPSNGRGGESVDGGKPHRSGINKNNLGLPQKNLLMIPARVALALQADGWYLRSEIIWHKPNPLPESVKDRPTKAHEMIYLLAKSQKYYYDADAVREPLADSTMNDKRNGTGRHTQGKEYSKYFTGETPDNAKPDMPSWYRGKTFVNPEAGRNRRDVWTVATKPYAGAHFAVFPPDLIEPCILAGTSAKGQCPECGAPWVRQIQADPDITTGWEPSCKCNAGAPIPDIVLDPFGGSGTVAQVAAKHGRNSILCELNNDSIPLIHERLAKVQTIMQI